MERQLTTPTEELDECDKRVTAAAWDVTIYRDQKRPFYFFAPPQLGDADFARALGIRLSPYTENLILVHHADDLEAS